MPDTQSPDRDTDEPTQSNPNVTVVGVIIEVAAQSRDHLREKLFTPDDFKTKCQLVGLDYDELYTEHKQDEADRIIEREMAEQGYTMQDVYNYQEEHLTVMGHVNNAVIGGHPVLTVTNGEFGVEGFTEVPHFNHGSGQCETPAQCHTADDAGGVFRSFDMGDLVLLGEVDFGEITGSYKITDDILISISSAKNLKPGENVAEPFEESYHR